MNPVLTIQRGRENRRLLLHTRMLPVLSGRVCAHPNGSVLSQLFLQVKLQTGILCPPGTARTE